MGKRTVSNRIKALLMAAVMAAVFLMSGRTAAAAGSGRIENGGMTTGPSVTEGAVFWEDINRFFFALRDKADGVENPSVWPNVTSCRDEQIQEGAFYKTQRFNGNLKYSIESCGHYSSSTTDNVDHLHARYNICDVSVYLAFLKEMFGKTFSPDDPAWVSLYLENNFANCRFEWSENSMEPRTDAVVSAVTVNGIRYLIVQEEYDHADRTIGLGAGADLPWQWFLAFAVVDHYVFETSWAWTKGIYGFDSFDTAIPEMLSHFHFPEAESGKGPCRTPDLSKLTVNTGVEETPVQPGPQEPPVSDPRLDFYLPASGNSVIRLTEQYSHLNFNFTADTVVEGLDFSAGNICLMEGDGSGIAKADDTVAFRWDLAGEKARYVRGCVQYRNNWVGWRFPSDWSPEYTGEGKDYAGIQPGHTYYLRVDPGVIRLKGETEPFSAGQPGEVPDWTVTVLPEESMRDEGWFSYASSRGFHPDDPDEKRAHFVYDADWFRYPSHRYNPHLAVLSLDMAIAATNGREELAGTGPYYIEEFFKTVGFEAIQPNHWYYEPTQDDSCGVCIASRKLGGSNAVTLIAVAIRGGNYGKEWAGDFRLDTGTEHEGFRLGKVEVLSCLEEYVKAQGITGRVKVWIAGYSRASAICNLTAAELARGYDLPGVTLAPDDLFAYGFEVPACTRDKDAGDSLYRGIFSIVNPADIVPRLPLAQWGYLRYGTVLFLPTPSTDPAYHEYADEMQEHFEALYREAIPKMPSYEQPQNISEVLQMLYGLVQSPEEFTDPGLLFNRTQIQMREHTAEWMARKGYLLLGYLLGSVPDIEIDVDFNNKSVQNIAMGVARSTLGDQSSNEEGSEMMAKVVSFLARWDKTDMVVDAALAALDALDVLPGARPGARLAKNILERLDRSFSMPGIIRDGAVEQTLLLTHYMEFTLAWMEVLENTSVLENSAEAGTLAPGSRYYNRMIRVNCPVIVEVWDEEGELEASVSEDGANFAADAQVSAYTDTDGTMVVLLPPDRDVTIRAEATDEGTMQISVETVNPLGVTGDRVTRYYDLPLTKGKAYELAFSTGLAEADYEAVLTDPAGAVVAPDMDETAADIRMVTVSALAAGNGMVSGGGRVLEGSVVSLTAEAFEGEEFLGWFDGSGVQIGTEEILSVRAEADAVYEARFTEKEEAPSGTDRTEPVTEDETEEETERSTHRSRRTRAAETEEPPETGEAPGTPGKNSPVIPIAVIAGVLVAGGGAAALLLRKKKKKP